VGLEKWDIGRWDQGALDRGFMEAGMHPPRVEGNEYFGGGASYIGVDGSYLTEVEGDYVIDFIDRHGNKDKPFFMYFVPLAVHIPNTEVPVKYLKRLYPEHSFGKYSKRQYLRATLLALDDQVGLIRKKLYDMGIAEDTLIMFSSDNGGDPSAGHRPLPYRGGKGGKGRSNLQWRKVKFAVGGQLPNAYDPDLSRYIAGRQRIQRYGQHDRFLCDRGGCCQNKAPGSLRREKPAAATARPKESRPGRCAILAYLHITDRPLETMAYCKVR